MGQVLAKHTARVMQRAPPAALHPREMLYPATFTAQLRQYPWRFMWRNEPVFRGITYGGISAIFIMHFLTKKLREPDYASQFIQERNKEYQDSEDEERGIIQKIADVEFGEKYLKKDFSFRPPPGFENKAHH